MSLNSPKARAIESKKLRFGIVASRFNEALVDALVARVSEILAGAKRLEVVRVPGAHEIPWAAQQLAVTDKFDCVIALGVLIGGDTNHHEMVGDSVSHALQHVAMTTGVPVINGVIVANTMAQAEARTTGSINRGAEFAHAALQMAALKRSFGKKIMTTQFNQRRECRAAAFQYLYAWSVNQPSNLGADLELFFGHLEQPRDYYAFAEELIHGAIEHVKELDEHIKALAHNWEFDRIARIDLAILRLAMFEMLHRKDIPPVVSINEAIDLSKLYSSVDAKRFINGILDRMKDKLGRDSRKPSNE